MNAVSQTHNIHFHESQLHVSVTSIYPSSDCRESQERSYFTQGLFYNNLLLFKNKFFSVQTYKHISVYTPFLLQGQDFAYNVYVNNFLFMILSGLMMARLKWPKHLALIHKNICYVLD